MPTIIDDEGNEIEVVQHEAVAALASVGALGDKLSGGAAKAIQHAMSMAVSYAYNEGITDPDKIKELMMAARENAKRVLFSEQKE